MKKKVRLTRSQAQSLVSVRLRTDGAENLVAATGAKLYYLGNGWWLLQGYAYDGRDLVI